MTVDSYLELFTTMYGWGFAGIFRDVLVGTGLIYLPFIMLILGTWMEAHKQASHEGADAAWMIRVMEIELGTAIFVLAFCFTTIPGLGINKVNLRYNPDATAITPSPAQATPSSAGSYATAFNNAPSSTDIPLWWYTVMGLSSGITEAVKAGIGNDMIGFRQVEEQVRLATINQPTLRAEVQRFWDECTTSARSQYYANPGTAFTSAGQNALSTYGETDVEWIGSHFYQVEPGFYDTIHAIKAVPGFAVDPTADADVADTEVPPDAGRPTCNAWWTRLSTAILDNYQLSGNRLLTTFSTLSAFVTGTASSSTTVEDETLKLAVNRMRPTMVDRSAIMGSSTGVMSWARSALGLPANVAGTAGAAMTAFETRSSLISLVYFAIMAQPLILMGIYMFIPLIVVVGRYSLEVMFLGGLAIFTVKMWPLMWFIARLLDDHLILAMYPEMPTMMSAFFDTSSTGGLEGAYKIMLLNTVLVGLYLGLPFIWTGMMGWLGYRVINGIADVKTAAISQGMQSGARGGGMATKFGSRIGSKR